MFTLLSLPDFDNLCKHCVVVSLYIIQFTVSTLQQLRLIRISFTPHGLLILQPFNDRASHFSGSCIFGYNSAPAAAREVFKPSTDSASLVGSSQKKIFSFGLGVLLGGRNEWGCFRVFMAYFDRPWTPIEWARIFDRIFL